MFVLRSLSRRSTRLLILAVVLLIWPVCSAEPTASQYRNSESRILIITSQPYATEWFNSFNDKFVEKIQKIRAIEPKISYEYIDGKIASDPVLAATVNAYLQHKYDWQNIELVIGVMPAGSSFLLEHGDKFAKAVPRLFVLPSPSQILQISHMQATGIIQSTGDAIGGTIRNIRRLLPDVKQLYVVAGTGQDDKEYLARTRRMLAAETQFEQVVYLEGLDATELQHQLSQAPQQSAVLFLSYVMNRHGQPTTSSQIVRSISPQIHIPVFGFYDTLLGKGIVGGHLTSTEAYGEVTAVAAQRLLSGEKNFFAATASPQYMYDWRQLQRWRIDSGRLPADSQVRYVEYSLWDLYKWQIVVTVLLLVLQGLLIMSLLFNRTRRRKLEQELLGINARLEERVQERTTELAASNEELQASNQELSAMNEEMRAMNETLDGLNHQLLDSLNQLHQMEEDLIEKNKKLKELDQMKSMFIASMSHELRTPLNSIIGFTGMTLQEMSGPLNEEQKDNLSRVKKSANHLLALITDVIDISKIESGRIDSYVDSFSLHDLIREAAETVRAQIAEKGMSLSMELADDVRMCTDRRRLLQCLINFLSNALKYSEAGTITISAAVEDGMVELSVRDTGIGIAAADLPKLFEPFERVKSHLQVKAGGTGLGLYLTKKLTTEVLQGNVAVESVSGAGSTFRIRVPQNIVKQGGGAG